MGLDLYEIPVAAMYHIELLACSRSHPLLSKSLAWSGSKIRKMTPIEGDDLQAIIELYPGTVWPLGEAKLSQAREAEHDARPRGVSSLHGVSRPGVECIEGHLRGPRREVDLDASDVGAVKRLEAVEQGRDLLLIHLLSFVRSAGSL